MHKQDSRRAEGMLSELIFSHTKLILSIPLSHIITISKSTIFVVLKPILFLKNILDEYPAATFFVLTLRLFPTLYTLYQYFK